MILIAELKGAQLDYWVAKAEEHSFRRIDRKIKQNDASWLPDVHQHGWLISQQKDGDIISLGVIADGDSSCFIVQTYSPSTDWSQGGPIIERERIVVDCSGDRWVAKQRNVSYVFYSFHQTGETYLEAAMRCYVASRFGEEVDQ